ncbi:NAD(P)-dependent oxidoreductase [Streptomyces roseoverticillatus]|uniref:NAD-dependent epimerase/dehydratase family protein n=1 Tax=Streptomyces roseoverticillatus TaxID=66429 RepID=UPI001F382B2A|nr:NAD(P)-dependent oxidoreductase [Streptomyces roseoverticillatus]MCF3105019.1 NAD(P)-dependent oxidoreductase [Streptomyces roseoverticillatus]
MPASRTVLLTGAAGRIGTHLRALLPAHGHRLRLLDIRPVPGEPDAVTADLAEPAAGGSEALRKALDGVDAVVHLAGIPVEAPFADILRANVEGTYRLYEAVREAGVRRVVLASSNHAVGFTPLPAEDGRPLPVETPHRPDTLYGLSKCFGEDLASLYRDRHGIETVSLRIGACFPEPTSVRMLSVWLSPGDCARLVHAALTAEDVGHTVAYGSSANTRAWWDLSSARALGYAPRDDSEPYAPALLAAEAGTVPEGAGLVGGEFCGAEPPHRHPR